MTETLRITEIFCSLQGEAATVGRPTVFVRLTGCPLRCAYCDTAYAFSGGVIMDIAQVLQDVASYGVHHVTVTGGEPLAQPECRSLLSALCDQGYEVSLETSGALDIAGIDGRVSRVMDLKTPASGEEHRNLIANITLLGARDQVKFVICSRKDYDWSVSMLRQHDLAQRVAEVLFSPSHQQLEAVTLADWIVADRLPVRFQMQLHKLLWQDGPGR